MAKFYVGQRVRVVSVDSSSAYDFRAVGMEGVVNELDCESEAHELGMVGVTLSIPANGGSCDEWCFEPEELEPILDQKHEACDEDFKRDLDRLLERQGVSA